MIIFGIDPREPWWPCERCSCVGDRCVCKPVPESTWDGMLRRSRRLRLRRVGSAVYGAIRARNDAA